jgi:hypothetical protein
MTSTLSAEIIGALPARAKLYALHPDDADAIAPDLTMPAEVRRKVLELQAAAGPAYSVAFDNALAMCWGCYLPEAEFWMLPGAAARARPKLFLRCCRAFVYITMRYHRLTLGRMRAKSGASEALRFGLALGFHVEQSSNGGYVEMIRRFK